MFRRIFTAIKSFFLAIAQRIRQTISKFTYYVSRIVTGAVAIGGALCGINTIGGEIQSNRLAVSGFAFIIGLPLGLLLFGPAFNLTLWLGLVIATLFIMNLHTAWEVLISLKYGGLDYIMAQQAIASVDNITPSEKDIKGLQKELAKVQKNLNYNTLNGVQYNQRLLGNQNA